MTETTCPECRVAYKLCRSYAEQCPKCGRIQFLFSQTEVPVVANDSTHERAISVTHEDLRQGRLNIYKLTGDEAADLVAEYDAVVAELDQLRAENKQLQLGILEMENLRIENDQLREIIREHVPYPASPDSEPANHSETPNSSTQTTTPID